MPIWFMVLIALEFAWLGYETKWLTIRLYKGKATPAPQLPKTAAYHIHYTLGRSHFSPTKCYEMPNWNYSDALYHIFLSPGLNDVLCGWEWLNEHCADLVNYHPKVELCFGNGYKQTFTLKKPELIKQIVKINTGKKYFKQLLAEG